MTVKQRRIRAVNVDIPYRHPTVRDLAWAIGSPPLMQPGHAELHWPEPHWFASIEEDFQRQLCALDRDPAPLLSHLKGRKDLRLGKYFECLWHFWLQHNPRYRLLHANVPVREGGRTLGEFDFLLQDQQTCKTLHWEVAVKFYLGTGDTRQACHWWGPGLRDRLDKKTQHLLNHQSALSRLPQAQLCLDRLGIHVDESWALLKGRLFYPAGQDTPAPAGSSPGHLRGFWTFAGQFAELTPYDQPDWLLLSKDQWLASVSEVPADEKRTRREIADSLALPTLEWPVCVARSSQGNEVERCFVVPDSWNPGNP